MSPPTKPTPPRARIAVMLTIEEAVELRAYINEVIFEVKDGVRTPLARRGMTAEDDAAWDAVITALDDALFLTKKGHPR